MGTRRFLIMGRAGDLSTDLLVNSAPRGGATALPKGLDSLMSHGLQERQEAPIMDKAANSGGVKRNRKYQ